MAKRKLNDLVWVEKYRPKTIKETILPNSLKDFFTNMIKKKDLPNLLLYSTSGGVGKSAIAKAICNEMDSDFLYINASNTGIDILRTDIKKYAHVKSLTGRKKIVILDEFCGATNALMNALKADIEKYLSCRFILTANHVNKIIQPLRSRLQEVSFNMSDKKALVEMKPQVIKRLEGILKHENVEFNKNTIPKIVETFYPDIRKMINVLQQYSLTYGIIDDNIFDSQQIDTEFFNYILKNQFTKARKYLIEKNVNYDDMFRQMYDSFIPLLPKEKQGQVIIEISNYMNQSAFAIDKEINFSAMLLEIMGVLSE